jgi:hypothetical protein
MQQQQQQQDAEQQRDAAAGRRAAHLAPASVTSTPRVVETPREVARDLEMQDLVLQLQQARADALYWRSELEKFLQSYERLSGSMTRAAARLEERMQAQALRFRELRAQDVKKMHALARALQQSQLRHPRASSAAVAELAGSEAAASSDAHRVAGLTAHDAAAPSSALSTFFSGEELAQLHHQLSDARLQIFNLGLGAAAAGRAPHFIGIRSRASRMRLSSSLLATVLISSALLGSGCGPLLAVV